MPLVAHRYHELTICQCDRIGNVLVLQMGSSRKAAILAVATAATALSGLLAGRPSAIAIGVAAAAAEDGSCSATGGEGSCAAPIATEEATAGGGLFDGLSSIFSSLTGLFGENVKPI